MEFLAPAHSRRRFPCNISLSFLRARTSIHPLLQVRLRDKSTDKELVAVDCHTTSGSGTFPGDRLKFMKKCVGLCLDGALKALANSQGCNTMLLAGDFNVNEDQLKDTLRVYKAPTAGLDPPTVCAAGGDSLWQIGTHMFESVNVGKMIGPDNQHQAQVLDLDWNLQPIEACCVLGAGWEWRGNSSDVIQVGSVR